jgi:hypothetical protein
MINNIVNYRTRGRTRYYFIKLWCARLYRLLNTNSIIVLIVVSCMRIELLYFFFFFFVTVLHLIETWREAVNWKKKLIRTSHATRNNYNDCELKLLKKIIKITIISSLRNDFNCTPIITFYLDECTYNMSSKTNF